MRVTSLLLLLCLGGCRALSLDWPWASLRPSIDQTLKSRAFIDHVPGYGGSRLPSEHYGGYITVDKSRGRHLYYYLVKSETQARAPLVLWLNGGPGCSSFDGFVKEHGPFKVVFKGPEDESGEIQQDFKLVDNEFSWSKAANMLYVDSPAGVGMSYSETLADYHTNDTATIADLHTFLARWLREYPEFEGADFYVAGESYAGVYVPLLVASVAEAEDGRGDRAALPVRLRGYLVGNPVADTARDADAVPRFLQSKSLISARLYEHAWRACDGGRFHAARSAECRAAREEMDALVRDINHYDILGGCYHGKNPYTGEEEGRDDDATTARRLRQTNIPHPSFSAGAIAAPLEARMLGHTPRCLDQRAMWAFANSAAVRAAIHARPIAEIGAFDECTNGDRIRYRAQHDSVLGLHAALARRPGLAALVYSGDHDMVIPHTSTEAWTADLGLRVRAPWAPWTRDDAQVAGFAVHYDGLVYATVLGAGHAVPESKPREALALFSKFLRDGRLR